MSAGVLIRDYDPEWPELFRRIAVVLGAALDGIDHRIEHVGSTAVPGLAAKPIIDIDIVYPDPSDFLTVGRRLARVGYVHNGDQGIAGREAFKRSPEAARHPVLDSIRHHLYGCAESSGELRRHLLFRDYLRRHEWARAEYHDLKRAIAARAGQDHKTYAALKEAQAHELIMSIIARAEHER